MNSFAVEPKLFIPGSQNILNKTEDYLQKQVHPNNARSVAKFYKINDYIAANSSVDIKQQEAGNIN